MTNDSGAASPVETASSGVEDLAGSVTSALGKAGPAGDLAKPVVNALQDIWEGYFGAPSPPGQTNWNAYTHQQLYDMIFNNADVGGVSSMAADWGQHSSELSNQATALRGQQTTMRSNWSGQAAEPATSRLGQLGDRNDQIGTRAGTVQKATQNAGDALSTARNTMPPPPGDPTALELTSAVAGAGVGAVIGGLIGAGAGGVGAGPGALIGAAIGAVVAGGASVMLSSAAAAEKKAEAVHEIAVTPGGATQSDGFNTGNLSTSTSGYAGASSGEGTGGVPWRQLVGTGSPLSGNAMAAGARSAAADAAMMSKAAAQTEEMAAAEMAAGESMYPPMMGGARRGSQDTQHRNRMPTDDRKLFEPDQRPTAPVIGVSQEGAAQ
jgi:hypothetical protein